MSLRRALGSVGGACLAAVVISCGTSAEEPPGDDAGASATDSGPRDASVTDSGPRDASATDSGVTDSGVADSGVADSGVTCPTCAFGGFAPVGAVSGPGVTELSGLVASRARPGVFYTHNDSGDTARFFALSATGATLAEYTVTGATNVDWEDIALAPCGADRPGTCVFLGDIGDNLKARADITIYRVPEPVGGSASIAAEALPVTYPDGPHDAEALFTDGAGALFVVSKETSGASTVYALGAPRAGATLAAQKVGKLPAFNLGFDLPSRVTAADYYPSPACPRLAIRTYGSVELFVGRPGDDVAALLTRPHTTLPRILTEQQGEAVAFSADGLALYTVGEGANVALNRATCP